MQDEARRLNDLTARIIGAAIEVHRKLGPGLLESAYEACLYYEPVTRGLKVERLKPLPLVYEGVSLDCAYRMDLVIENSVIVEVKAVAKWLVDELQRESVGGRRYPTLGEPLSRMMFLSLRSPRSLRVNMAV